MAVQSFDSIQTLNLPIWHLDNDCNQIRPKMSQINPHHDLQASMNGQSGIFPLNPHNNCIPVMNNAFIADNTSIGNVENIVAAFKPQLEPSDTMFILDSLFRDNHYTFIFCGDISKPDTLCQYNQSVIQIKD